MPITMVLPSTAIVDRASVRPIAADHMCGSTAVGPASGISASGSGARAMLGLEDDVCTVKEIVPGGPADLNRQLKPNDKIIAVAQDGAEPVEIIGMRLRKIVDMIRGGKGTRVHLIVQPASATVFAIT